jgi:protein gp37
MTESKIEWTDRSDWNPIRGCTRVSPGCGGPGPHGGCYAEAMAARFSLSAAELEARWRADPKNAGKAPPVFKDQWGHGIAEMKDGKPRWTGMVEIQEDRITLPLKWRKPAKIFVSSTSDLFHEALPDEAIDKIFAVMALCPQHTFQVLTKRAERMREYLTRKHEGLTGPMMRIIDAARALRPNDLYCMTEWPLPNVWLGISFERQQEADERIPLLLQTPASVSFISGEPLLGAIDLTRWFDPISLHCIQGHETNHVIASEVSYMQTPGENIVSPICPKCGADAAAGNDKRLDWVIVGGESGSNARPMHPDWARSIRDQCEAAGVPFFMKQWGGFGPVEISRADFLNPRPEHLGERVVAPNGELSSFPIAERFNVMRRMKKKSAGRLLDGRTHDGMPGK